MTLVSNQNNATSLFSGAAGIQFFPQGESTASGRMCLKNTAMGVRIDFKNGGHRRCSLKLSPSICIPSQAHMRESFDRWLFETASHTGIDTFCDVHFDPEDGEICVAAKCKATKEAVEATVNEYAHFFDGPFYDAVTEYIRCSVSSEE